MIWSSLMMTMQPVSVGHATADDCVEGPAAQSASAHHLSPNLRKRLQDTAGLSRIQLGPAQGLSRAKQHTRRRQSLRSGAGEIGPQHDKRGVMVAATANNLAAGNNNTAAAIVSKQAGHALSGSPKRPKHSASSADGAMAVASAESAQDDVTSRPVAREVQPPARGAEQPQGRGRRTSSGVDDRGAVVGGGSPASSCGSARQLTTDSDGCGVSEAMVGVTGPGEEVCEREMVAARQAAGKQAPRGGKGRGKRGQAQPAGGASKPALAEQHIVVNATGELAAAFTAQAPASGADAMVDRKLPAQFDPSTCHTLCAPRRACSYI